MPDALMIAVMLVLQVALWAFIITCLVRICRKAGFSAWGALWVFFWPVGLGLLAFKDWPALKAKAE